MFISTFTLVCFVYFVADRNTPVFVCVVDRMTVTGLEYVLASVLKTGSRVLFANKTGLAINELRSYQQNC